MRLRAGEREFRQESRLALPAMLLAAGVPYIL